MRKLIYLLILGAMFIISCGQEGNKNEANNSESDNNKEVKGKEIYNRICTACHQSNGEGTPGSFPPLAKSDFLKNKDSVIAQVLNGKKGEIKVNGMVYNNVMPPMGTALKDQEVVDVINYVYASFGNDGSKVTIDQVKHIRATVE